jgi:hypothetical protein
MLLTDNACAVSLATNSCKIKRTKSIDMRFHWIRDRVQRGEFTVHWRKGVYNLADFFTKPLPVHHHQRLMPLLIRTPPGVNNTFHTSRMRRLNTFRTRAPVLV